MTVPKHSILVVDDDEVDREIVLQLIGGDFRVSCADSAEAGLRQARQNTPDCVLLDFCLHNVTGLDMLEEFRETGSAVVMLTGYGDEAVATEALKSGAQDYLSKTNLTRAKLLSVIGNAVEKQELQRLIAERTSELEEFATIVAHELKRPVGHISRLASRLQSTHRDPFAPEIERDLDRIAACADEARGLVDDLLRLSERSWSRSSTQRIDLTEVFAQVIGELSERIADEQGTVTCDMLPAVMGDGRLLSQLFKNLFDNALKFRCSSPPAIHVSACEDDGFCHITVCDNGIGFDAEFAEVIFAPFRRLHSKSQFEGSGVGLTICKKIVNRHGGRIWADRSEMGGAAIHFTLMPAN